MKAVYIVGPYGCGKTSAGKALAKLLNMPFIDVDEAFRQKFGRLDKFLEKHDWRTVMEKTSEVLRELPTESVVIAQALFKDKETEDIKLKDAVYFKQKGLIVLVLPSRKTKESVEICLEREKKREYEINAKEAVKRLKYSIPKHREFADIIVYDNISPESAAKKIFNELKLSEIDLTPEFRIANKKDVEQIYDVMIDTRYIAKFYEGQNKEVVLKDLEKFFEKDKCITIVVVEINNKIIGYSIFEPYAFFAQQKPEFPEEKENYAYSLGTGVLKKFRRKGIGKDLRSHTDNIAQGLNYKGMYTDVDITNTASLNVQVAEGFKKIKEINNKKRFIFKKTF